MCHLTLTDLLLRTFQYVCHRSYLFATGSVRDYTDRIGVWFPAGSTNCVDLQGHGRARDVASCKLEMKRANDRFEPDRRTVARLTGHSQRGKSLGSLLPGVGNTEEYECRLASCKGEADPNSTS